jgi:hypothetical protein
MDTQTMLIIGGGILLIGAIAVFLLTVVQPRRRSEKLRGEFGSEYDRTMERYGDQKRAEADLADRKAHVSGLRLRALGPAEQARYSDEWQRIQARFVDHPADAIREADALVAAVMRDRGYPVDDFVTRAGDLSVNYPDLTESYRSAHTIFLRSDDGADTEELRQALVHYRDVFAELLAPESLRRSA